MENLNEEDFGDEGAFVAFYPSSNKKIRLVPMTCVDGWFTSAQLRNIADELDRRSEIEEQGTEKDGKP